MNIMYIVPEKDYKRFIKALDSMSERYDPDWKGPAMQLGSANYHTTLSYTAVHSTRDAFQYGAALLASGRDADLERAIEVLDNVVRLQDQDPTNATYGIWSWYMDEPLEKMSPPDWNWANFCGKEIIQVLRHHSERLPGELVERLKKALRCACMSIFRRNMHCYYTNICIMGAYVTLAAGQLMDWPDMFEYGKNLLHKFYDLTRSNSDAFVEYNSSTYTVVAIEDLSRIYEDIDDAEVRFWAEGMLDAAWNTVAQYFHAPTRQWSGPNSRSYQWLLKPETLSFLQLGLNDEIKLVDEADFKYEIGWAYLHLHCPDKYRDAFLHCKPHDICLTFQTADGGKDESIETATAHLCEKYSLGSWRRSMTWNQRRDLLAYWGGDKPRFMGATLLHDLYDFSSGMLAVAQRGGNALVTSSLHTNGGDTHCNLDMVQNATIRAYDLRLRFEFGGALTALPSIDGDTAVLEDGDMRIAFKLLGASFDGQPLKFSVTDSDADTAIQDTKPSLYRRFDASREKRCYLDVVFYSGEERDIDLSSIKSAYAAVCLSMEGLLPDSCALSECGESIQAKASIGGAQLSISSPARPMPREDWHADVCVE